MQHRAAGRAVQTLQPARARLVRVRGGDRLAKLFDADPVSVVIVDKRPQPAWIEFVVEYSVDGYQVADRVVAIAHREAGPAAV